MNAIPLIVCGMGRSGTRTVADILSAHERIQLYGEIPPQMIDAFMTFLDKVDLGYFKNPQFTEDWKARKLNYLYESFNALSKTYAKKTKDSLLVCGYKSPRHEMHFKKLEKHFNNADASAHYIYCTRSAETCWASYKSMPWNSFTLETFLEDYKQSLREYHVMKEAASERVHVFSLDAYTRAPDRYEYFKTRFLVPLGIEENERVRATIESNLNRNATVNVTKQNRKALLSEEVEAIQKDPDLPALLAGVAGV
ncbi:sulfotransferase [Hyphomonas sp.]|uniref:sulfotransferase n=1 Tax=Hyphomonas sp. TaxID=87 RepID=UPI000C436D20|nr:sulfotransferase [Hyphomonas sp.]MAB09567.1 hypothetical protein [Hyphomonas sp.]MAU67540.1 hypothetical protein [Hyphomonas sp.]MBM56725.1 hypothetical protein [Hyphomonas sp.]|tara:strand:- start:243 stop:1001 length:759 start_codon:yes stop_codon:yes gene_type:complete